MSKFGEYNIQIKTMPLGKSHVMYHLTNDFFEAIGEDAIQKGDLQAVVSIDKGVNQTELNFAITGKVVVLCDRCLEEMNQNITAKGHLIVKLGKEFQDDGDDVVIVPEEQGCINVAWFLYEFINLAIPIKHVHPFGLCNKETANKLSEILVTSADEDYSDDPDEVDSDEVDEDK